MRFRRTAVLVAVAVVGFAIASAPAFAVDTVFVPLDPCRIIDTRFSLAGKMALKETRAFDIVGATTDYSVQGGQAAGCGVPGFGVLGPDASVQAVVVNVVAVSPDGNGHLRAWAGDQVTMPLAAILTYNKMSPSLAISNGVVIPVRQDSPGDDMNIYAHVGVDIVMDITGYFTQYRTNPPLDGISCWDLNANGVCDAPEDVNISGSCDATDCAGPQGPQGDPGVAGTAGLSCWDLNANGVCDLGSEDADLSGACNALDCAGNEGPAGLDGLACWDLNANGSCDLGSEDIDVSGDCDALDCKGPQGDPGGGGGMEWIHVTTTPVSAASNTGYYVDTATRAIITLPAAPVAGDIVRVSGIGAGGWRIAQNAGQSILAGNLAGGSLGAAWVARESARWWLGVASSSDGTKLAAVAYGGQIFTSGDSGVTWTARDSNRNWYSIASSSDGTKLVAVEYNGQIYTSPDSGANWTPRDSSRLWYSVASSSDGVHLAAVVRSGGQIYTSDDSGATWTPQPLSPAGNWYSIASSADGTKLAAVMNGGQIYTSTDSGVNWTPRESNRSWWSIASSADGTKLAAVVYNGQIYTSADSGATWTVRERNRYWKSIASSSDGQKLTAAAANGSIYVSDDFGVTWRPLTSSPALNWSAVASSTDGTKLTAAAYTNFIWQAYPSDRVAATTVGTVGYLAGEQGSAVELQYMGGDTFMPISYVGAIIVN